MRKAHFGQRLFRGRRRAKKKLGNIARRLLRAGWKEMLDENAEREHILEGLPAGHFDREDWKWGAG
jgi:hypothetical protein